MNVPERGSIRGQLAGGGEALRGVRSTSTRGQALVLVVLGLSVLLGAVALGVDGSRMFEERRAAQGAVDHAATTAAFSRCSGNSEATAIEDGKLAADRNGYDNDGSTNVVVVTALGGNLFRAGITSTIDATFGRVLGWETFDVSVEATADCTSSASGGGNAIWAGGDNCIQETVGKYQLDVSGSGQHVYGGVHVNGDVNLASSPNSWTDSTGPEDPFTYVGEMDGSTIGNTFEPGFPTDVGPAAGGPTWPTGYAPSDIPALLTRYQAMAVSDGNYSTEKITSISGDGVYYTTHPDGMDISTVTGSPHAVTLVAENGPIKISGSNTTLNAYTDNLLLLANRAYTGSELCDKYTVAISGTDTTWNGVMWAPAGVLEVSGSSNSAVHGSLIGWAVKLNGSDIRVIAAPIGGPTSPPQIWLVE